MKLITKVSETLVQLFIYIANYFQLWDFFSILVRYLRENEMYSFQVFSISTNDYQAGSNEYDLRVPFYRLKMRIVAISVTLIILLMLVIAAIYIYTRRQYTDTDEKLQHS